VVIFEKNTDNCKLATIVLRGATNNLLDDVERAIDDGVNLYRCAVKDNRFVYGGGATEMVNRRERDLTNLYIIKLVFKSVIRSRSK